MVVYYLMKHEIMLRFFFKFWNLWSKTNCIRYVLLMNVLLKPTLTNEKIHVFDWHFCTVGSTFIRSLFYISCKHLTISTLKENTSFFFQHTQTPIHLRILNIRYEQPWLSIFRQIKIWKCWCKLREHAIELALKFTFHYHKI